MTEWICFHSVFQLAVINKQDIPHDLHSRMPNPESRIP
ncbi:hypothetical protein D1AOALGA4SA_4630 [Olavius algarvensis Delta 1 endosymbiont]|nr:hypothetical protein D1AOALGA4SA_4630 [Olavius algarvensis Delta 1 endosymbiont]